MKKIFLKQSIYYKGDLVLPNQSIDLDDDLADELLASKVAENFTDETTSTELEEELIEEPEIKAVDIESAIAENSEIETTSTELEDSPEVQNPIESLLPGAVKSGKKGK